MYCFDTDTLSAALRPVPPLELIRRLAATAPRRQHTTSITLGELHYGAVLSGRERLLGQIDTLIGSDIKVLPFDRRAAETYAPLRVHLERAGMRLAEPDLRIASIALARDLTMVTGNVRHFERVPGLRVENWLRE